MANQATEHDPKSHWPSVEEQLSAAKAIPGSAFEKFIRLNQDFELLRPGETQSDSIRLPPGCGSIGASCTRMNHTLLRAQSAIIPSRLIGRRSGWR